MDGHTVLSADDVQGPKSRGILSLKGINDYVSAELADNQPVPSDEPPHTRERTEPYGMYWIKHNSTMQLRPHDWFIKQVASYADGIFGQMHESWARDPETAGRVTELRTSLGSYLSARQELNEYAYGRKLKQEADDACYQMCQAAKFFIDATEKAKWLLDNGRDLEGNQQLQNLKALAEKAGYEGYVLMRAVRAIDAKVKLDFEPSAKRVIEWSCRKLTEWFAARESNIDNEQKLKNLAQAVELLNLFKGARPEIKS